MSPLRSLIVRPIAAPRCAPTQPLVAPPCSSTLRTLHSPAPRPCAAPRCAPALAQPNAVPLRSPTPHPYPCAATHCAPAPPRAAPLRSSMLLPCVAPRCALVLAQPHTAPPAACTPRCAGAHPMRYALVPTQAHAAPLHSPMLRTCADPCCTPAQRCASPLRSPAQPRACALVPPQPHAEPLRSPTPRSCAAMRCAPVQPHSAPLCSPELRPCPSVAPRAVSLRSHTLHPNAAPHCTPAQFKTACCAPARSHAAPLHIPALLSWATPCYALAPPHTVPLCSHMSGPPLPLSCPPPPPETQHHHTDVEPPPPPHKTFTAGDSPRWRGLCCHWLPASPTLAGPSKPFYGRLGAAIFWQPPT